MKAYTQKGFTIVELLIVIVIIGILASITVVAFNGVQDRARVAVVSTDLANAAKQLAIQQADTGSYPSDLSSIKASDGTTYQYSIASDGSTYCITATKGSTSYKIGSSNTSPTSGGCPGHGVGGAVAITNLALNPSFETSTTNWSYRWYGSAGGAGTNSRGTNGGMSGTGYIHKTWTVAGAAADNGFNTHSSPSRLAVTAGTSYVLTGYMRTNRSDVSARTGITWYDSANAVIGSGVYWGSSTTLTANGWQRLTQTATAPAGATQAVVYFSNGNSVAWAVGDTLSLDAVMFSAGASAVPYADGNTANWVWNGTEDNSTSTGPAL